MKKITTFVTLFLLCLCGTGAEVETSLADAYQIYVTAESAKTYETATLVLNMKNRTPVTSWACTLLLPEGVTFKSVEPVPNRYPEGYNPGITTVFNNDGSVTLSCQLAPDDTFAGTEGPVATVLVDIAGTVVPGDYAVQVRDFYLQEPGENGAIYIGNTEFVWTIEEGEIPVFTVTIIGEGVTVSNTHPVLGETLVITVLDIPDYEFTNLLLNDLDITLRMTGNTYVLPYVDSDITVQAIFKPVCEVITIGQEYVTFSCSEDLYFGDSDLKAYIASGFNRATNQAILMQVTDVPKGTGLLLIGEVGKTYKIPYRQSDCYYVNLLKPVLERSWLPPYAEGGAYENYVLVSMADDMGFVEWCFYSLGRSNGVEMPDKSSYLQLPANMATAGAKVGFIFEDDVIDGIGDIQTNEGEDAVFDLQGRRVSNVGKGIYIVNGKKVLMK